jgi:hypothetical protein
MGNPEWMRDEPVRLLHPTLDVYIGDTHNPTLKLIIRPYCLFSMAPEGQFGSYTWLICVKSFSALVDAEYTGTTV